MHRPVFSMPSNIAEKLRTIVPDVPDPMMEGAKDDPSQMYLLKQASVLDQQNVIMGGAMDTLIEAQKVTNGRINEMEPKVERNTQFVEAQHGKSKEGKWRMEIVWVPIGLVGLQIIAHKLGYL